MKYREFLNGPLQMVALFLEQQQDKALFDPGNLLTFQIRQILRCVYGMSDNDLAETEVLDVEQRYLAHIMVTSESSDDATSSSDELACYMAMTRRPDPSCKDVLKWWRFNSEYRFLLLGQLARENFWLLGSSVPSEFTFSDSGQMVRPSRGALSDLPLE